MRSSHTVEPLSVCVWGGGKQSQRQLEYSGHINFHYIITEGHTCFSSHGPASGTLSWLIHTNTQLLPVVNIRHVENLVRHFHVSLFPADSVPISLLPNSRRVSKLMCSQHVHACGHGTKIPFAVHFCLVSFKS